MQTGKQIYSIFELVNSNVLNLQSLGKIYHLQKDGLIKCQNGAARINPYSGELIWQKQFDKLQSIRVQNNECLVLHGDSMSILNPNTGQLVVTHQVGNHPYQLENAIINTNNQLIIFSPDYKNIECTVSLPSSFKTTRYSLRNTVFQEDYIYQHRRDRLVFSRINTSTGNILFTRELVGDVRVSNGLFHNRSQNKLVSCNEQGDIQELILPEEGNLEGNIFYTSEKAYLVDRDNLQAGIKGEILFPEKNIKPYLDFYRDINKVFEPQVFSSENNVYFLDLDSFTIKTTVPKTAEEEITINFPDVFIYNKESNVYKRYSLGGNLLSNTSTLPNSTKQRLSQYGINNTQRLHSLELADHIVSRREAFDAKRFEEFTNKPLRVIFHGSEDEHGAFDINSTHNLLSSDANLLYFEIHSEQEFFSNLDRLKNMGVPIELLVISGHGSERFLAFGGANPEGLQTVEDETQYLDIHDREQLVGYSQLLRNGAIVLNSCSTGGQILGYNLQEILAETIGQFATVYAPNKSFQRERISIRDTVEVDFGGSAKVVLIDNIPKNQKSPHESASSTPPQQ